jgi:hypothetical protein
MIPETAKAPFHGFSLKLTALEDEDDDDDDDSAICENHRMESKTVSSD